MVNQLRKGLADNLERERERENMTITQSKRQRPHEEIRKKTWKFASAKVAKWVLGCCCCWSFLSEWGFSNNFHLFYLFTLHTILIMFFGFQWILNSVARIRSLSLSLSLSLSRSRSISHWNSFLTLWQDRKRKTVKKSHSQSRERKLKKEEDERKTVKICGCRKI